MTNNLKIEVLVSNIPEDGSIASQFPSQEYVNQQLAKKANLSPEGRLDPSHAPDYTEIPGLYEHIEDTKDSIETSIADSLQDAKGYTNQQLSANLQTKADLVNGKIPFDQIPFSADIEDQIQINVENITAVVDQKVAQVVEQVNGVATAANSYTDTKVAETKAYVDTTVGNVIEDVERLGVSKAVTIPTYLTPEAGVAAGTGVAAGAYFNVRSGDDEAVAVEYQNIGGVGTPSGKSYPSSSALGSIQHNNLKDRDTNGAHPASAILDASGLNQQEFNDSLVSIGEKLDREFVSVWDFFTKAEIQAYNLAIINVTSANFDSHRPVQEFFDYIRTNAVLTAYCSGVFRVSRSVKCGLAGATLTKSVTGDLTLYALNEIDTVFDAQVGSDFVWTGAVKVYGTGSGEYSTRTCRAGIRFGANADRSTWGLLRAQYFYELGVQFYNKTTLAQVGRIRCFDCGSGYDNAGSVNYSLRSSYTHNTNMGSSSSASQRSVLNVAVLPPADLDTNAYVVINNRAYWISAIDRTASTITVFPWIDSNYLSGDLRYIFGAGVDVFGGDASLLNISAIDTMRCGVSYSSRTLYPATIGILTTQANGVALSVGSRTDSASIGGCISQLYTELNNFDIFPLSRGAQNFEILNTTALNYSKINYFAPRSTSNIESYAFYGLSGFIVGGVNGLQMLSKTPRGVNTATTLNLTSPNLKHIHRKATSVFNLYYDQALNDAFGYDATELTVIGTAANNLPTQVTFNPDSGRTVNGKASEVFSGFSKIPTFSIFYDIATNNYVVINTSEGLPQTSVTYDPPSLATGQQQSTTVTLNGAAPGNVVECSFNKVLSGTRMWAEVTAANTVTVYHRNDTSAAVDVASGTLTVKLI